MNQVNEVGYFCFQCKELTLMLVVLTETPEEIASSLKDYFLIKDHYAVITIPEEVDDNVDSWCDDYGGAYEDENMKLIWLESPFLVLTKNVDVVYAIKSSFVCQELHEIKDIEQDGIKFMKSGFLPVDVDIIKTFIQTNHEDGSTLQSLVFSVFKALGYLDDDMNPTDRFLKTLAEDQELHKYASMLSLNMTNKFLSTNSEPYKNLIFELLKTIDGYVFEAAYEFISENQK